MSDPGGSVRPLIELVITFGPSRSPHPTPGVLRYACEHGTLEDLGGDRQRITFMLGREQQVFGAAAIVLSQVGHLKGTEIQIAGEPERESLVKTMAWCARRWLRLLRGCGERYPDGLPYERCLICPLRTERALEVPDHVPEDWTRKGW
jgi:hypothetical protein